MKRVTIKTLNNLLSVLGICVVRIHAPFQHQKNMFLYHLSLVDDKPKENVYMHHGPSWASHLEDLVEKIMKCEHFAVFYADQGWQLIDNLYFGCKSLEEAMIRKDLAGNG